MKVCGAPFCPESHKLSAVQLVVQLPEVVEWKPLTQFHTTVVLTGIVVVLVPLTISTNFVPPSPTLTVAVAVSEPVTRPLASTTSKTDPCICAFNVSKSFSVNLCAKRPLANPYYSFIA